jgi:hypothetical protein
MAKNRNYTPHNEYRHIETRRTDEDWEKYLWNLSKTVGAACDKFFEKRGMTAGSVDIKAQTWGKRNETGRTNQVRDESKKDVPRLIVENRTMK